MATWAVALLSAVPVRATPLNFNVTVTARCDYHVSGVTFACDYETGLTPFKFGIVQAFHGPGTAAPVQTVTVPGKYTENYSQLNVPNTPPLTTPMDASLLAFNTHGALSAQTFVTAYQYFILPTGGTGYGGKSSGDELTYSAGGCELITSTDNRCSGFFYDIQAVCGDDGPASPRIDDWRVTSALRPRREHS